MCWRVFETALLRDRLSPTTAIDRPVDWTLLHAIADAVGGPLFFIFFLPTFFGLFLGHCTHRRWMHQGVPSFHFCNVNSKGLIYIAEMWARLEIFADRAKHLVRWDAVHTNALLGCCDLLMGGMHPKQNWCRHPKSWTGSFI